MVCSGGGGGGGGDGDGERGRTTLVDFGFDVEVAAAAAPIFDACSADLEGPAEGGSEFDSTVLLCSVLTMVGIVVAVSGGSAEIFLLLTVIASTSSSWPTESESESSLLSSLLLLLRLEVVEPEIGGRGDDGSLNIPAERVGGAGDVEDLGDKFSEISLTSDISKSSEVWPDIGWPK